MPTPNAAKISPGPRIFLMLTAPGSFNTLSSNGGPYFPILNSFTSWPIRNSLFKFNNFYNL